MTRLLIALAALCRRHRKLSKLVKLRRGSHGIRMVHLATLEKIITP